MEGEAALRNQFRAYDRVPVNAQSCIQSQPLADILTEIYVGSYLVGMLLLDQIAIGILYQIGFVARYLVFVPCATAEVLPINSHCYSVALEEVCTLIPCDACYVVVVFVEGSLRSSAYVVSIVDVVVSPVAVSTQGTAGMLIAVAQADAGQSTCNLGIVVDKEIVVRTGVAGIEVCDVSVGIGLPVFGEVIA